MTDLLATDRELHLRESSWLDLFKKYECTNHDEVEDDYLDSILKLKVSDEEEEDEDICKELQLMHPFENVNDNLESAEETEGEEQIVDENMYQTMLEDVQKALAERKRLWEETGESFIMDHLDTTMKIDDFIKEYDLNDSITPDLDISTCFGNYCKKKKKSHFQVERTAKAKVITDKNKRQSVVVFTKTKTLKQVVEEKIYKENRPKTPSVQSLNRRSQSVSDQFQSPTPLRRVNSVPRTPRTSTIIYTPDKKQVPQRFKEVLKLDSFDPSSTLVYEPPTEDFSSSESDDDIFLVNKRRFGGTIYKL